MSAGVCTCTQRINGSPCSQGQILFFLPIILSLHDARYLPYISSYNSYSVDNLHSERVLAHWYIPQNHYHNIRSFAVSHVINLCRLQLPSTMILHQSKHLLQVYTSPMLKYVRSFGGESRTKCCFLCKSL